MNLSPTLLRRAATSGRWVRSIAIRLDLEWCEVEIDHDVATPETFDRLRLAATYAIEKGLPVAKCRALEYPSSSAARPRYLTFATSVISFSTSKPILTCSSVRRRCSRDLG